MIKPHTPTVEELGAVACLCTAEEWARLIATQEFIDATCDSLERVERVASHFTGRTIATGLTETSVDRSL